MLRSRPLFAGDSAVPLPHLILPQEFGGWQLSGIVRASTDPAVADPVNAAVLKEYGFN